MHTLGVADLGARGALHPDVARGNAVAAKKTCAQRLYEGFLGREARRQGCDAVVLTGAGRDFVGRERFPLESRRLKTRPEKRQRHEVAANSH